jgi:hypothetical protein
MRRRVVPLLLAALSCMAVVSTLARAQAAPKQAAHPEASAELTPELAATKAALDKYRDPIVAVRDGYFSTVGCIDSPKGAHEGAIYYPPGAMGIHFLNPRNIGPKLDPTKPQILLYEPVGNGKLDLVGAEWFVPVQVAGGKAPMVFGQTLAGPMDGHEPVLPKSLRHYDLHVWLWRPNPRGVFTSTNSAVKCEGGEPYRFPLADMNHHM